eukprot:scaffold1355_cov268-Pinguiococcus_pyrenoidosus.AAC.65
MHVAEAIEVQASSRTACVASGASIESPATSLREQPAAYLAPVDFDAVLVFAASFKPLKQWILAAARCEALTRPSPDSSTGTKRGKFRKLLIAPDAELKDCHVQLLLRMLEGRTDEDSGKREAP